MSAPAHTPWRHSLATRLLLWAVGVTGLILAALILWSYLNVLGRIELDARERAGFLAEGSADRIDSELAILQGLARGIALGLEARAPAISHSLVRTVGKDAVRAHPQIYGLGVALLPWLKPGDWPGPVPYVYRQPTGFGYLDAIDGGTGHLGRDWFHLPRYLEREAWSEPYRSVTGVKMVTFSVPIQVPGPDGPRLGGVVFIDIELGWLDQVLEGLPLGPKGYGVLLTHNGTYVSHAVRQVVFNETVFSIAEARADAGLRRMGQRMVSGQPGLESWLSWAADEPSWIAWHPLKTVDWTLGAVISQAELRADIRRLSRRDALAGLAGLVVLVLAVWLVARSIIRPVTALGAAAATLAAGHLGAVLPPPRGRDEVAQLTTAFAAMRDDLRRHIADLAETTAAQERIDGELRVAQGIQMDLIPRQFPAFPGRGDLDIYGIIEPARYVGGDFYDFFLLDPGRLVLIIGDVAGKGVPAALMMAGTRSFLRSAFRGDDDPGRVLTRVNADLASSNDYGLFVTIFCAVLRLDDGWVDYANAGHNPPAVVDPQGRIQWLTEPADVPAGILMGSQYANGRFRLSPGASWLLYSDGVTEAMDPGDGLYGSERLAARLATLAAGDCRACLEALLADVKDHAGGAAQSDDITLLMVRLIGRPG